MDYFFIRLSENVDLLRQVINAIASLFGFLLIFRALLKLKIYGEMRSMMAPHARLNQILLLLFVGIVLIALPSATTPVLLDALFGTPMIKELQYNSAQPTIDDIQYAAKRIMRLIGSFALVRGILQIGTYQEGGRHSLSKSLTHIIAGILAINIQTSLEILMSLFGVDLLGIGH